MTKDSDEKKELYNLLDFSDAKKEIILDTLINKSDIMYDSVDVSSDVYTDTGIDKWCETLPVLEGSRKLICRLVHNPINIENLLKKRQQAYFKDYIDMNILKDYENDVLWVYKLDNEIKNNNLIYALFPSSFILKYINYVEPVLQLYHMYKIYLIPLNTLLYPILSVFAPLYYLKKYLKFNLSIASYVKILYNVCKLIFSFSGNLKANLVRIITMSLYFILFCYNFYQAAEYSFMLQNIKNILNKKLSNLSIFLKEALDIIKQVPTDVIPQFIKLDMNGLDNIDIGNKFSNIYKIWKDNTVKEKVSKILLAIYTIDVINSISKLCLSKSWCLTKYTDNTKLWNMKNPVLSNEQIANPANLSRNIVITGPNAAGKTTYVKSILSNILLAQTFGISYAIQAEVIIYDYILSFMRIRDVLGSKSYFEAEADYCLQMMKKAQYLSENNMHGLFMMDEPMHSTPPTEGMSTAFAVAEYIGNLPGTNIILTTHFHKLVELAELYPSRFINLSVEAVCKNNDFEFPYTIKRGHSYQCIAIELLSSKEFPKSVIQSAINMKNKIYDEINRDVSTK